MQLSHKTSGNSRPQGKPRVYFSSHPADRVLYFQSITDDILKICNCAIYYMEDLSAPDYEDLSPLSTMQLFVIPVTRRFLTEQNRAKDVELPFALDHHIPVLPIMQEAGLEVLFNQTCGNLQTIGRDDVVDQEKALAGNVKSYEEKLESYINSVLVSDQLAEQIRNAFDAYIFLSYRKVDREEAQKLMKLIHCNDFCRDIAIWYDEFLVPGENFDQAIADAMEKSKLFVLTVTPHLLEAAPNGEPNYVMGHEYPDAVKLHKAIFPAVMKPTDPEALNLRYKGLPDCADPQDAEQFHSYLLDTVKKLAIQENDRDPQHNFFIGLAYLNGIDVEKDTKRALELITGAAEDGLPEAYGKLVQMYRTGNGVARDYQAAIQWQEKLVALYYRRVTEGRDIETAWKLVDESQNLGGYCMELPDYPKARDAYLLSGQTFQLILDALKNIGDELDPDTKEDYDSRIHWFGSAGYDSMGDAYYALGELEEAKKYYEASLELNRVVYQNDLNAYNAIDLELWRIAQKEAISCSRRNLFISLQRLGDLCQKMGDTGKAEEYYREMEALAADGNREQDQMLASNKKADYRLAQGDLQQAENYYKRQYDSAKKLYEEFRHDRSARGDDARQELSAACDGLAIVCMRTRRLEEAEAYSQESLIYSREWQENSGTWASKFEISVAYETLARINSLKENTGEAERYYQECLTLRKQLYAQGPSPQSFEALITILYLFGDFHLNHARFQEAQACITEMYETARARDDAEKMGQALDELFEIACAWINALIALSQEEPENALTQQESYESELDQLVQVRELGEYLSEKGYGQHKEIELKILAMQIQERLFQIHCHLGHFEQAVNAGCRHAERCMMLWEKTGELDYGNYASITYSALWSLYFERDNLELAAYYARKALNICRELYRRSKDKLYLANYIQNCFHLASCYWGQAKWPEALHGFEQTYGAVDTYMTENKDAGQEMKVMACRCLQRIGVCNWKLHKNEDAKPALEKALEWSCILEERPHDFALAPREMAQTGDILLELTNPSEEAEKALQYAALSYGQWGLDVKQTGDRFSLERLASVCCQLGTMTQNPQYAQEACTIWGQLAKQQPDNLKYAQRLTSAQELLDKLERNRL